MPEVAKFTPENPCTKKEIWNCFRGRRGFKTVDKVIAWSVIGKNTPRYLLKKEYIVEVSTGDSDAFQLTENGKKWLITGIKNYLKNHPQERDNLVSLPR